MCWHIQIPWNRIGNQELRIKNFNLIMGYKNWAKSVWIEDDGKERIGVIPELWVEEDKPAEEKSKAFIKNLTLSSTWESFKLIKVKVQGEVNN